MVGFLYGGGSLMFVGPLAMAIVCPDVCRTCMSLLYNIILRTSTRFVFRLGIVRAQQCQGVGQEKKKWVDSGKHESTLSASSAADRMENSDNSSAGRGHDNTIVW